MAHEISGQEREAARKHQEEVTRAGNPAHPEGEAGSAMLERMNRSHAEVTNWALDLLHYDPCMRALDVGCGGGATMRRLGMRLGLVDADGMPLADAGAGGDASIGHVTGADYSAVSCEESRAFNKEAVAAGLMDVVEASVDALPFADSSFDVVTTVESFYFWPNPLDDLEEVRRVLGPGGRFLLVADVYRKGGLSQETLDNISEYDLTVLDPEGYCDLFEKAGFSSCKVHLEAGTTWIAVEGAR